MAASFPCAGQLLAVDGLIEKESVADFDLSVIDVATTSGASLGEAGNEAGGV